MATLYDENGDPVTVPDHVLTGGQEGDAVAELARMRSENARQAEAIKRLASKPGMSDEELPAISTLASEAAKAERARGGPQDEVLSAFVGAVAEETSKRGAAKREAHAVAERFDKLAAELEDLRGSVQA